ncbi:hypothetical protein BBO99_00003155 [Phytophthora kernoviae]|uniref:BZIP domain-containing protein n=2 Tax=Phytophthora kernoviae TaxID=325452 RepID=A0A3R7IE43_9STRA|nr:hypothetical protein BBI17_003132 [Phytophthora kernoviae]RLN82102.1 hypothetical protein BBO99_00003155 [Phytophthora kernoviae]
MDRAMQVVLRETATIPTSLSPEILFQELDLGVEGLGKTSTAVYAFNTRDASKAFQVTCQAILTCSGVWPEYSRVASSMKFVDVPPTKHHVRYGITQHTYRHNYTKKQVSSEARDLYYSRMTGSCGVLVWDYVDDDDLYPLKSGTLIKRNTIGALVMRPEICQDGVERMVCRSICTDMQILRDISSLSLNVAEFALLEDMIVFETIKEGATDWITLKTSVLGRPQVSRPSIRMELQTGVLEDETLKINASGVVVRACEGRGAGQVDDWDMNFLSELLPPSGEFEAQSFVSKTLSGDSSPTAESSDAAETSSSTEELMERARNAPGAAAGRPKRPKKSVSTTSLSSSSSSVDVEMMEIEVEEEQVVDRKARRRAQVANSARRLRCRKKYEMMTLKTEATLLEQQLDGLRLKHKQMRVNGAVAAWEVKAIVQRHKRRQAEQTNEQLRQALFLQSGFVRNLRSMFSTSMPCTIELNMRNFLHTPTHLLKDSNARSDATGDQVFVETREISYYHWADGCGVLLWDYVDADDAHPQQKDTAAMRCTIGAVLVRPEICLDGVERMVCRNICTKVHTVDTPEVTPAIERFSKSRQLQLNERSCKWSPVGMDNNNRAVTTNLPSVGSGMNLLGILADADFDTSLLSELLLQDDGVADLAGEEYAQTSETLTTVSNDESSSSDDTSGLPDSPKVASVLKSKGRDKVTDRKAKRRAQVAVSARRHRYRKKHEMLGLRMEVGELTGQLHSLRSEYKLLRPNGQAEEYTMAQRHKRRQSEKMNEQLRRALVMQRRFFTSMQAFVLNSPIINAELNMCSLLHTFTCLGKMPYSRRRDYLALCTDSKADLAVQILLRETEGMNFAGPPSIVTHIVPAQSVQQQIVTTVAAYAFETLDLKSVFVSACDGIIGCGTEWPQYKAVSQYGEVKDKPLGNIRYGVSDTSYQRTGTTATQIVSVESRSIIFYRMSKDHGVLVWDFADEDDLYPVKPEVTIKRDLIGAAMVRREMCPDGAERVVCRSICTKFHSFSLPPTASEVSYYLQQSEEGAKMCGFVVYNHIREHASQPSMASV